MSETLNIALIQTHLLWENPQANRINFQQKIESLKQETDLVVLPEMITTGFTMKPGGLAETMKGETIQWLKDTAADKNLAVTGSLIVEEKGNFFNRAVFVHPSGKIETYDKRHTFTLAGEDKVYKPGNSKTIIEYKGWKICPLICYDLRFPVWSRNVENYDLLIYMANWPKARINAWDTLLQARAIENMSYTVGVNRIGLDGKGYEYLGHSSVYNVLGNLLAFSAKDEVITITLNHSEIQKYRASLKFLNDKDEFILK
ncbi:amidohydrolase [Abyssalbus ytuae]|uniref:Omega-amidase YafV n=1 Tax=Abyssalbus ytuae TaxID=2926907 RepID=A0A9E6ZUF8_9FLAO|nr:amidohydrolase [Abyssalbus ytuae]UOB19128.1 amidohydrolase [Abyssalbus ytuae]